MGERKHAPDDNGNRDYNATPKPDAQDEGSGGRVLGNGVSSHGANCSYTFLTRVLFCVCEQACAEAGILRNTLLTLEKELR